MRRRPGHSPATVLAVFVVLLLLAAAAGRYGPRTAEEGPSAHIGRPAASKPVASVTSAAPARAPSATAVATDKSAGEVVPTPTARSTEVATPATEPAPTRRAARAVAPTTRPTVAATPAERKPAKAGTQPPSTPTRRATPTAKDEYYTAASGDSLWSISRAYRVTVTTLARANGLSPDTRINVGQRLRIPRGGAPATRFGLNLPDAAPAPSAPREAPLADLAPRLVRFLSGRQGASAAAVYAPSSNTMYTWNGKARFEMASTVKVPIMVTQLSEQYSRDPETTSPGTDLLMPMITASDNNAATALLAQVGGPRAVEAELRARGVTSTHINPQYWGLSTTTASDMAELVRSLYYGARLNTALRDLAFGLMSGVIAEQRWGVPMGLPASSTVAFKGGWLPVQGGWLVHQVGVVNTDGESYIFALYNRQQPTFDYGKETLRQSGRMLNDAVRRR